MRKMQDVRAAGALRTFVAKPALGGADVVNDLAAWAVALGALAVAWDANRRASAVVRAALASNRILPLTAEPNAEKARVAAKAAASPRPTLTQEQYESMDRMPPMGSEELQ